MGTGTDRSQKLSDGRTDPICVGFRLLGMVDRLAFRFDF